MPFARSSPFVNFRFILIIEGAWSDSRTCSSSFPFSRIQLLALQIQVSRRETVWGMRRQGLVVGFLRSAAG